MNFELTEAPIATVTELELIPSSFVADRVYDVLPPEHHDEEFVLSERTLEEPFTKDYDRDPAERPTQWASQFDVSNWGFIRAESSGQLVGGAVVAFRTAHVAMLEGRTDLAVLWDIRVLPDFRRHGVGSALFRGAETWAVTRGNQQLKIETQNINVPACRFYARHGCVLRRINRFAYPGLPGEVQLLWFKDLVA